MHTLFAMTALGLTLVLSGPLGAGSSSTRNGEDGMSPDTAVGSNDTLLDTTPIYHVGVMSGHSILILEGAGVAELCVGATN